MTTSNDWRFIFAPCFHLLHAFWLHIFMWPWKVKNDLKSGRNSSQNHNKTLKSRTSMPKVPSTPSKHQTLSPQFLLVLQFQHWKHSIFNFWHSKLLWNPLMKEECYHLVTSYQPSEIAISLTRQYNWRKNMWESHPWRMFASCISACL